MPTSPKKIIKKVHTAKSERADGSSGYGLSKRDRFGNPYYSYWTKECCPVEHRQIVFVNVDAAAEKLGVRSGVWTYDWIRKHSLARMREIPHYVQFGAHLKFAVAEGEERLCDLNPKRKPKGTYWPEWLGSRRLLPLHHAGMAAGAHRGGWVRVAGGLSRRAARGRDGHV